jgi:hypothetical protein
MNPNSRERSPTPKTEQGFWMVLLFCPRELWHEPLPKQNPTSSGPLGNFKGNSKNITTSENLTIQRILDLLEFLFMNIL